MHRYTILDCSDLLLSTGALEYSALDDLARYGECNLTGADVYEAGDGVNPYFDGL